MQKHRKNKNHDIETLPHRKGDPPTDPSTSRLRATPHQGSGPIANGRRSRLGISRLAGA